MNLLNLSVFNCINYEEYQDQSSGSYILCKIVYKIIMTIYLDLKKFIFHQIDILSFGALKKGLNAASDFMSLFYVNSLYSLLLFSHYL